MALVYLLFIFAYSLLLRLKGITDPLPFWVDEFSTAKQGRYLLEYGLGVWNNIPGVVFEHHNITTHIFTALSFAVFGQSEWAARVPSVIIGSLVPVMVFIFARKVYGSITAISASLLAATSYIIITWSRQARGYVLQELLVLIALYLYVKLNEKWSKRRFAVLAFVCVLGITTHVYFYLVVGSMMLHYALYNYKKLVSKWTVLAIVILIAILWKQGVLSVLDSPFLGANNLWYYHSFLWRVYGLITFLAVLGLAAGYFNKRKETILLAIYLVLHLGFVTFGFGHYMTKYLLPVFPLLFILAAYFISETFKKQRFVPIAAVLFIILNGDKFVVKPKMHYSLNNDFREIAVIDYNRVYGIIQKKGDLAQGKTAIIDTWTDRARWYVGNEYGPIYLFRWEDESGRVTGHVKNTPHTVKPDGTKWATHEQLAFIGTVKDLQLAMKKYPKGFIFIDDSTLPKEVIDYVKNNLKDEVAVDRLDKEIAVNPLSVWPSTLYSWGVK